MARVRLTQEEDEQFTQFAEQNGTTRSKLQRKIVRELITNFPDLNTEETKHFQDGIRQLSAIGRNLNQLSRSVNSAKKDGHNLPSRVFESRLYSDIHDEIKELKIKLDGVMSATENRWIELYQED